MKRVDAIILVDKVLNEAVAVDAYVDIPQKKRESLVRSIMQKYELK